MKKFKKIIRAVLVLAVLAGLIYLIPKVITVVRLKRAADSYVAASSVSTFKDSKTTIIYDTNDQELCTMKNTKDMYYVSYQEIPVTLVNSFVVMEDRQFYKHSGYDIKAILRAIVINQKSNDIAQGASTITQQLARNIFLSQEVTWQRKVEEIFIAVGLEKKYSKNQILEFYLNNIYFGNGYYGVEAAARGYFDKEINELSLAEQVFIAAIPNSPTRYNPLTNYDNTMTRRNLILEKLLENNKISQEDYDTAVNTQIVLAQQPEVSKNNSVETYARHCAIEGMMQANGFVFRTDFSSDDDYNKYKDLYEQSYTLFQQKLLSGGYKVYTSIDMDLQQKLQDAIDDNLKGYTAMKDDVYEMQAAATCIDNETGNVVAIVGARSQELEGYTLNRAYQSYRQPGSSIKPILDYVPYLERGNTPDTIVKDEYIENGPKNADGTYMGSITLRTAVNLSRNTVAWNVLKEITPRVGSSYLLNQGFHKIWMDKDYDAISIGGFTYGVSTEEMAGAYATIVNDGQYRRVTCVSQIKNVRGKVIYDSSNRQQKIYDSDACRMMTDMLKTAVTDGTGREAATNNAIVAGKTGTTNSNYDSWFCGYSAYYTVAVWQGYDYPATISQIYTKQIFRQFMESAHKNLSKKDFPSYGKKSDVQETTKETESETESVKETQKQTQSETQKSSQTQNPSQSQQESQSGSSSGNTGTNPDNTGSTQETTQSNNHTDKKPDA